MDRELIGFIGLILLVVVMLTRMPIAFVFAIIGFVGFSYVVSTKAAFSLLGPTYFQEFSSYDLSVIPLFVLMGMLAYNTGITANLFTAGYKLFGKTRGGLFMGTIFGSALFAACCGSSPASAATMGTVALPEMRRYNYSVSIAGGCVAASGSLAILIPPSITLVVYGILTEQSIGKLFIAGIIPGILLSFLFLAAVYIMTRIRPSLGPPGPSFTIKEKATAMLGMGEVVILFVFLMGGLFVGFFTPSEAGALGAAAMIVITLARRKLTWRLFIKAVKESVATGAMILFIIASAYIYSSFLAVTTLPYGIADWVSNLPLPPNAIMLVILGVYLVLGCFMDTLAMIVLTIPIFYPVALKLGFDPIWFGVLIVLVGEMGLITPPVGMNVFVLKGVVKDVPLTTLFKGIYPFLICEVLMVVIILFIPNIVLFLPRFMSG